MARIYFFLFFCILSFSLSAQIVNIESLRRYADTSAFVGEENITAKYTRNTNELLTLSNNLFLRYKRGKSLFMIYNLIDVSIANDEVLEQKLLIHGRYNYKLNERLTAEFFMQYQKDPPLKIKDRVLVGLGPRIELWDKDKNQAYFGALVVYEHDAERETGITHRDFRLSTYYSISLTPNDNFSWTNVLYYQPQVDYWSDYRVSVQSRLDIRLFKNLYFTSTLDFTYDSFPVESEEIPHLTTKWVNGIAIKF